MQKQPVLLSNGGDSKVDTTTELVQRWRSGDISAFESLVKRYTGPLLSYVLSIVRRVQDGEDVVQETFLRAFRSSHQLKYNNSVWLWLKQIAHNAAIDAVKKTGRQAIAMDPQVIQQLDTRREEQPLLPDIVKAIESLPETFRETAIYYYLEEWPYSRIAETLGIEPAAVRQRISRVNRLLRETLGKQR